MTNRKTTKRALFTSMLALLMCVAMLIGTTFAWFTDTASTNVNKVQAGTLDVDLQVATEYTLVQGENGSFTFENIDGWESAVGKKLNFIHPAGHENEPILWEPGCTHRLAPLRVINNGNLALKFKVVVTGIKGDAKLNEAIDWTVSTPDDIITLEPGAMCLFSVKGHMREDAGNEYQGLSIEGISLTVYATQANVEYDSFSKDYDKYATFLVSDAASLLELAANVNSGVSYQGVTVTLSNNIDLTGVEWTPIGNSKDTPFSGIFDGNNKTITGLSGNMGLFGWITGGTVMNLTISNATINNSVADLHGTGILAGRIRHGGTIDGVTVSGSVTSSNYYTGGLIGAITGNSSVTVIKNCTNNANVTSNSDQAGGIAGYAQCNTTISNCTNTGVVNESSGYGAGGIVGFMSGCGNDTTAPTIENCTNSGVITSAGTLAKAGGIAGAFGAEGGQGPFTLEANINSCTNTGTVNGTSVTTDDKAYYCGGKVNYNGTDTSTLTLKVDGTALNY